MQFMITWRMPHGTYKEAIDRFLATGAPVTDGLKSLGRWHSVDHSVGFHLVETDDPALLLQHAAEWKDLLELSVVPVVDDAAAAGAISKAFGK
jgi:uncharacterized protein DUF3303